MPATFRWPGQQSDWNLHTPGRQTSISRPIYTYDISGTHVNRGNPDVPGIFDPSRTFGSGNFNPFRPNPSFGGGAGGYNAMAGSAYNPNWEYGGGGTDPTRVTDQHGNLVNSPYSKGAFDQPNFMGFNANGQPMWSGRAGGGPAPDPFSIFDNNVRAQLRNYQSQIAQNLAKQKLLGSSLGTISDQLNAPGTPPEAAVPNQQLPKGGAVPPTPTPIDYVSSDRLNQGKGWAKFRNQAMGSPQFDQINNIFHQLRNVGPTNLQSAFQGGAGYQNTLNQAAQFGMTPEEFLKRYL